jgi:hypothetical protein
MTEIRRELNISTEAHFVRMYAYCWLCCAVHLPCETLFLAAHHDIVPLNNRPCWRR